METRTYTVFKYKELPEDIQRKALDKLRDINVDYDGWAECTIDDAKECAAQMGITIDKIYYSGFSSQGDGACFEGSYSYEKGGLAKIKDHAPKDTELHAIAKALQREQSKHLYGLTATVKHRGHYYHSLCTEIEVFDRTGDNPDNETTDQIKDLLRDFMNWIYSQLEKEYEYLTSEEAIIEMIEANDYDFEEDGNIA